MHSVAFVSIFLKIQRFLYCCYTWDDDKMIPFPLCKNNGGALLFAPLNVRHCAYELVFVCFCICRRLCALNSLVHYNIIITIIVSVTVSQESIGGRDSILIGKINYTSSLEKNEFRRHFERAITLPPPSPRIRYWLQLSFLCIQNRI